MKLALVGPLVIVVSLLNWTGGLRAQAPVSSAGAGNMAGLVVVDSAHPVAETERRLVQAIEEAGLKLAARVDHEANAKSVGLQLPPTVLVLFGNPKAGTVLMEQNRSIGIDLPLKVLIWEADGRVRLAYTDPAHLARRHGIAETVPVLSQVAQALQRFSSAATAR